MFIAPTWKISVNGLNQNSGKVNTKLRESIFFLSFFILTCSCFLPAVPNGCTIVLCSTVSPVYVAKLEQRLRGTVFPDSISYEFWVIYVFTLCFWISFFFLVEERVTNFHGYSNWVYDWDNYLENHLYLLGKHQIGMQCLVVLFFKNYSFLFRRGSF